MQPHEDMKPFEEEFIAEISKTFATHEEPYAPGAWERFEQQEKRKKSILWLPYLSGAAAVLLIGLLFTLNTNNSGQLTIVNKKVSPANQQNHIKPAIPRIDEQTILASKPLGQQKQENTVPVTAARPSKNTIPATVKDQLVTSIALAKNNDIKIDEQKNAAIVVPLKIEKEVIALHTNPPANEIDNVPKATEKMSFEDFLKTETAAKVAAKKPDAAQKKNSKWDLGLVVAPSIGNSDKINMGYGVLVGYAISEKIGIQTGLSYNQMAAERSILPDTRYAASASYGSSSSLVGSKVLESVQGKFTGIDIPVELRYKINSNFYANAGFSAFAIFGQEQQNNYLESKQTQRSTLNSAGSTIVQTVIVTERTNEAVADAAIKKNSYIGFYNFSVGYQKKLSKKYSWSAEPFLKVPMKPTNSEDLKLIGAGIRLKLGF